MEGRKLQTLPKYPCSSIKGHKGLSRRAKCRHKKERSAKSGTGKQKITIQDAGKEDRETVREKITTFAQLLRNPNALLDIRTALRAQQAKGKE